MLVVGLVTSVHCVTMCGTLVLSYAIKGDEGGPLLVRMLPHAAYQSAKITSYMVVGLALGALGAAFNLAGIRGWVTVFAGVFMILMGLNMTGKFPSLAWITLRPPKFLTKALMKLRRKAKADQAEGESRLATPVLFGALTGMMPCGPLQSAQIAAAGAGSALAGSIAMLGFGLGTMPLMLGFGAVSGMLGAKFKDRMIAVAAIVIMLVGLVMLNRGAMLVGSPLTFQTVKEFALGAPADSGGQKVKKGKDGVAEVSLTIRDVQFVPQALTIPANEKVRLIVDRQESNACSTQLAIPQLGVLQNLKANGKTVVTIPASQAGSFTLTCGMGMMGGRLDVGGGAAPGSSKAPLLMLLVGWGAIIWGYRRKQKEPKTAPAGHGSGKKPQPAPLPVLLGFTHPEIILILGALAVAVGSGLYMGGASV